MRQVHPADRLRQFQADVELIRYLFAAFPFVDRLYDFLYDVFGVFFEGFPVCIYGLVGLIRFILFFGGGAVGDVDPFDRDLPVLINVYDRHCDWLVEASWTAAARIQPDRSVLASLFIFMGVAVNDQVVRREVGGDLLFLVDHEDPQAAYLRVKGVGDVLRPVFVVVSAHHVERCDL